MSTPQQKLANTATVTYAQNMSSVNTNELGMREMQQRVYAARGSQYLLVKAPPASGKSRALMFVALDKLYNQGIKKVIVAVPERSIGASFKTTKLSDHGFFADWEIKDKNNLCTPGGEASKTTALVNFLQNEAETVLVCTHATLRFAFEKLTPADFNDCLIAIDEFHHVSANLEANRLGAVLGEIMKKSTAHIVAMTGSYFRGDSVPVLAPADEAKFTPVTFNYYDQLNGYQYLKTLGIGHHFYQGKYTDAIHEVLDLAKKTIIHIPSVNSNESTKDKQEEVGKICDAIGDYIDTETASGIHLIKRHDTGEILRVADLVDDRYTDKRGKLLHYITSVGAENRDAVDIIIALGMAKEGFDWPFAEHALTVGYRASLTEVIQIIGRVTRDSAGKEHAQFTNLVAEPDASQGEVTVAVNSLLKAITASLLMEQVLAPNFNFKTKKTGDDTIDPDTRTLKIKGFKEPSTPAVRRIVESDLNDLKATILQNDTFARCALGTVAEPEDVNKLLIPKIIRERYPELTENEVEEVRQHVVVDSAIKMGDTKIVGNKRFVQLGTKFVNLDELSINLIDSVNPFQLAFEVVSKKVTPNVLRLIQDEIATTKINFTNEELETIFPKIKAWIKENGKEPNNRAQDPTERLYGEALLQLRRMVRERKKQQGVQA